MLWIYVLPLTAGIVFLVPAAMRAAAQMPTDVVQGFIGFTGTTFGLVGLALRRMEYTNLTTIVAAAALGLAVGAVHPEILKAVAARSAPASTTSSTPSTTSPNEG